MAGTSPATMREAIDDVRTRLTSLDSRKSADNGARLAWRACRFALARNNLKTYRLSLRHTPIRAVPPQHFLDDGDVILE